MRHKKTQQSQHTKPNSKLFKRFKYFGRSMLYTGGKDEEINEKTAKIGQIFNGLKTMLLAKNEIPTTIAAVVERRIVTPTVIYGSEF